MSFRLWTIFYVFALVASAMAIFGLAGIPIAIVVLGFWAHRRSLGYNTLRLRFAVGYVLLLVGFCWLIVPAIPAALETEKRLQCVNNIKQLALATLNYINTRKGFPAAQVADANGKPMHSWRVMITPYLCASPFFDRYKQNEPWNGPTNRTLAGMGFSREFYECPCQSQSANANSFETNYFTVVGPDTAFQANTRRSLMSISDGTSKTIMLIEASGFGVHWMEPRDLSMDEAIELLTTKPQSGHIHASHGFLTTTYYETSRHVAFCDGYVTYLGQIKDPAVARALLTANGGEEIPADLEERYAPASRTVINWGRVWGLGVFAALSLLPMAWIPQRSTQPGQNGDDAGNPPEQA